MFFRTKEMLENLERLESNIGTISNRVDQLSERCDFLGKKLDILESATKSVSILQEQIENHNEIINKMVNDVDDLIKIKDDIVQHETEIKQEHEERMAAIQQDKEAATAEKKPWVKIISMEIDPANISNGSFEIDWNEFFIEQLITAGYQGKQNSDIVDQWFTDICRNVVLEVYEQSVANHGHPIQSKKIDNNKIEYK